MTWTIFWCPEHKIYATHRDAMFCDGPGHEAERIQVTETQPLVEAVEKLREAWDWASRNVEATAHDEVESALTELEKLVSSP